MIEPASISDWAMLASMTAGLGLYAALGHRWILAVAPSSDDADRTRLTEEPGDRAA